MEKRVVVAMSGGVDSSVAAALLKSQGYTVIGITMSFHFSGDSAKQNGCCGRQEIEDAERVAHKIGIKHYVINMQRELKERVIKNFCREYLRGRTPNPCVRCNQYIKFDGLLKKTFSLGAEFLATGHYACIERASKPEFKTSGLLLKKGKDKLKDQSYFLYLLSQRQLKHIIFPIGEYTKYEVRNLARKFELPVADKSASQEICFLPHDDYRKFLRQRLKAKIKPGLIKDQEGNVIGKHKGIAYYTIGQREGLGIAKGYPVYITYLDTKTHAITVGRKDELLKRQFLVSNPHFILEPVKKKVAAYVRIRYNHKEARALIEPLGNKIRVRFSSPQFAITPGQSAVFYHGDIVLGGGIIDSSVQLSA